MADISTENCFHVFLFSSFLGYQVLFETLSMRNDFPTFLDRFTFCMRLQRGIHVMTDGCWHAIQAELQPIVDKRNCSIRGPTTAEGVSDRYEWCDTLAALLETANLKISSIEACSQAVECLGRAFEASRAAGSVLVWCILVTEEFIDLLKQRRPEALVIVAYYAVLLHSIRDLWIVGDAGEFLVRSIRAYLGSSWGRWLA